MAQSTLHFSVGMLAGSAYMLPRLWHKWMQCQPISKTVGHWILLSSTLGIYATLPGIMRRISGSDIWTGWWSNIFIGYHLIEKIPLPSIALGELCSGCIFATQYAIILLAIYRIKISRNS
jgi:hypothetical protein